MQPWYRRVWGRVAVFLAVIASIAALLKNISDIRSYLPWSRVPAVWTSQALESTKWLGTYSSRTDTFYLEIELFADGKCLFSSGFVRLDGCTWRLERKTVQFEGNFGDSLGFKGPAQKLDMRISEDRMAGEWQTPGYYPRPFDILTVRLSAKLQ